MAEHTHNPGFAKAGTPTWGVNRFRQYMLTELVNDLSQLERSGLDDPICKYVQAQLREIIEYCESYGEQGVIKNLFANHLRKIADEYQKWNGPTGHDAKARSQRKKFLKKLRGRKSDFSTKVGRRQAQIALAVDDDFFLTLWKTMERLPQEHPEYFPKLQRAIRRVRAALERA